MLDNQRPINHLNYNEHPTEEPSHFENQQPNFSNLQQELSDREKVRYSQDNNSSFTRNLFKREKPSNSPVMRRAEV
jgi:hypothetical protein